MKISDVNQYDLDYNKKINKRDGESSKAQETQNGVLVNQQDSVVLSNKPESTDTYEMDYKDIEEITNLVQSGKYQVNAEKVAQSMLDF